MDYLDFDLEINPGAGREYPLVVRSPAGEARETLRFPYDTLALENALLRLQLALRQSGSADRRALSPEQQAVRDFGATLFNALFTGEARNRYDVSLEKAEAAGKGLRVRLRVNTPELAVLPWEVLCDPRLDHYLNLAVQTPVVRYLELPRPPRPLKVTPPLRLLALAVSPANLPHLELDRERQRVERALQGLTQTGQLELHWLPGHTWRDLQAALRRGPWHLFHFIGHGGFDRAREEGLLYLEDEQRQACPLYAGQLGRLLANAGTVRLAFLNACEGAAGAPTDLLASTAATLVQQGLPAVVAMQYAISDRAAIELARTFYEALADGYPVDAALVEARTAVEVALPRSVEWAVPVLYLRAPEGVLFEVGAGGQEAGAVWAQPQQQPEARSDLIQSLTRALENARRTLAILEAQAAGYTSLTIPPHLQVELEDKRKEVAQLEADLKSARQSPDSGQSEQLRAGDKTVAAPPGAEPGRRPAPTDVVGNELRLPLAPGVEMIFVRIPAGEFLMGSDKKRDPQASDDELLQRKVYLDEYWMAKYPVTNAQYRAFVQATQRAAPRHWQGGQIPAGKEQHPVVYVSWHDAVAFCDWLNGEWRKAKGEWRKANSERQMANGEFRDLPLAIRLPTEAEWEKAARGTDGRLYPWGNDPPDTSRCNFEMNVGDTTPVGQYSPRGDSPYGCADMSGNVWEWCADWYDSGYYRSAPARNPAGPASGGFRVVRGGAFLSGARSARCACRGGGEPVILDWCQGFRLVAVGASPVLL